MTFLDGWKQLLLLMEDWFYKFGSIKKVTVDNGPYFKNEFVEAMKKIGATLIPTKTYYHEGNWMIERGHRPIKDTLVKIFGESGENGRDYVPLVFFADRSSTKRST